MHGNIQNARDNYIYKMNMKSIRTMLRFRIQVLFYLYRSGLWGFILDLLFRFLQQKVKQMWLFSFELKTSNQVIFLKGEKWKTKEKQSGFFTCMIDEKEKEKIVSTILCLMLIVSLSKIIICKLSCSSIMLCSSIILVKKK